MRVLKFGGSSVADRGQIEKVLDIVRRRQPDEVVVVTSAHRGMTDALVSAARRAAAGHLDPDPVIDRQRAIAGSLEVPEAQLAALYAEIRDLLRGIHLVKELSPRSLDYISSFGERMACRCLADFFRRHGVAASAYDAWDVGFVTDGTFGRARPLEGFSGRVRAAFAALPEGEVPVVTGFIGKNAAGEITTVGRNGSDLTATLLASALGAEEAQIWTDTDGVMTADPSVVDRALNIPHMRFAEAAELAYFGSRVLHPSSLLPAIRARIPVRVLNTNRPEHPGTVIAEDGPANPSEVTSIAYKEGQRVLTLTSTRMFGQVGFLAETFAVLARHGVVVDMVATSEVSVSLTSTDGPALEAAVAELGDLAEARIDERRAILAVVGQHLATRVGLASRVLRAVAGAGINVEMISYGSGAINLSMVIREEDIAEAVATLHGVLFDAERASSSAVTP
ncbi:MAG: aspartate kinase [Sandaracinaceae bacterium]